MTLNQTVNNIGDLLDKYRRNEITTEEFKLMLRHLNDASDDELRDLLQTEWDEFDKFADLPEEKISALYDAIRPAKTVRRVANVFIVFAYGDSTTEEVLVPMVLHKGVWYMR